MPDKSKAFMSELNANSSYLLHFAKNQTKEKRKYCHFETLKKWHSS